MYHTSNVLKLAQQEHVAELVDRLLGELSQEQRACVVLRNVEGMIYLGSLKLTKEQQSRLDQNREKHKAEFDDLMNKMSARREELRVALESEKPDLPKITLIHQELKRLMNKQEDRHLAAILEIRDVLTPEQFSRFQKMAPDRKGPPQEPLPCDPDEEDDL